MGQPSVAHLRVIVMPEPTVGVATQREAPGGVGGVPGMAVVADDDRVVGDPARVVQPLNPCLVDAVARDLVPLADVPVALDRTGDMPDLVAEHIPIRSADAHLGIVAMLGLPSGFHKHLRAGLASRRRRCPCPDR